MPSHVARKQTTRERLLALLSCKRGRTIAELCARASIGRSTLYNHLGEIPEVERVGITRPTRYRLRK